MGKIINILKSFPKSFWVANNMELFERLSWYGFYVLFANYLTGSFDDGGLEFTQSQKGWILGVGTAIVYFLPVITGALADKFGYKKMLFLSFIVYFIAFLLLPHFNSYYGVFAVFIFLALGAALFKPIVSATVAKTTNDKNSSIGFGIFYMMVNAGAFIGPLITLTVKGVNFKWMFYISAAFIILNFIILYFFTEVEREKNDAKNFKSIVNDILTVLKDVKFVIFLFIVAGFWSMYFQLFFSLPVFIEHWVDSSSIYRMFEDIPFIINNYAKDGQMKAEFITNFDAMFIIIFQIVVSYLVMKLKPVNSIIIGIIVASIGMALTFFSQNVIYTLLAMLLFSFGEMASSPKITEYIGRIAPKDKKGLYMGYSFIPVFLGSFLAGYVSGPVFGRIADKHELLQKYIIENEVFVQKGINLNQTFANAAKVLDLSERELTNLLWNTYNPDNFYIVILTIGLTAAFLMLIYNKVVINKSN